MPFASRHESVDIIEGGVGPTTSTATDHATISPHPTRTRSRSWYSFRRSAMNPPVQEVASDNRAGKGGEEVAVAVPWDENGEISSPSNSRPPSPTGEGMNPLRRMSSIVWSGGVADLLVPDLALSPPTSGGSQPNGARPTRVSTRRMRVQDEGTRTADGGEQAFSSRSDAISHSGEPATPPLKKLWDWIEDRKKSSMEDVRAKRKDTSASLPLRCPLSSFCSKSARRIAHA